MVKSVAGILALVLFFNVQVSNAQRVAPPPDGGGISSSAGNCVYVDDEKEPQKGKGYCRNTNACAGVCKKQCKTRTVKGQKTTTCECKCKSNGCKYTMTLRKPPAPPAGATPGAGTTPTPGATPTPEVESVTCVGSCTDASVNTARVGNFLANIGGRAVVESSGSSGAAAASDTVTTEVVGVCKVIDQDPASYAAGETGCDCVSQIVMK